MSANEEPYFGERVVGKRLRSDGREMYFIKWKRHPTSRYTWETVDNVHCQDLIDEYELLTNWGTSSFDEADTGSSCDEAETGPFFDEAETGPSFDEAETGPSVSSLMANSRKRCLSKGSLLPKRRRWTSSSKAPKVHKMMNTKRKTVERKYQNSKARQIVGVKKRGNPIFIKKLKAEKIVGVQKRGDTIFTKVKWQGIPKVSLVLSEVACKTFPHLLLDFYEANINFKDIQE